MKEAGWRTSGAASRSAEMRRAPTASARTPTAPPLTHKKARLPTVTPCMHMRLMGQVLGAKTCSSAVVDGHCSRAKGLSVLGIAPERHHVTQRFHCAPHDQRCRWARCAGGSLLATAEDRADLALARPQELALPPGVSMDAKKVEAMIKRMDSEAQEVGRLAGFPRAQLQQVLYTRAYRPSHEAQRHASTRH